jgi:tetratricopeptide (TPR) repeat protein
MSQSANRVMTVDNNRLKFYGNSFAPIIAPIIRPKSSLLALFVFVLLFLLVSTSDAKDASAKKGWALKPIVSSEQSQPVEDDVTPLADAEPLADRELSPELALEELEPSVYVEAPQPSESPDSLSNYDVTEGAAPLDIPLINVSRIVAVSPELRESLERQFQQIQTLKETEDAFSEQLGESYLAYGRSLMQAGRTDDARKMLVNALHIAKVNNGVTSIEQRPILRELFEMNLALGSTEEMTQQLGRIVWLEKNNPDQRDIYSFDMVVRLGNYYLDLYLNNPVVSELSLKNLNQSTKYLGYAVSRYGDRPLSEILLPYGELALAHYLQNRIKDEVDRSFYQDTRQRGYNDSNRLQSKYANLNSYSRSEGFLKDYLRKAKNERDLVNTIQALLGLGDLNLLTGRTSAAKKYFDLAWSGAQNLPISHPIVESFNRPVKLPSFNFSIVPRPVIESRPTELVALSINIDDDGRVRTVAREALSEADTWTSTRARRLVKRYKFRPIIENGKLVASTDYRYEVQVVLRKPKSVVSKDSAEQ